MAQNNTLQEDLDSILDDALEAFEETAAAPKKAIVVPTQDEFNASIKSEGEGGGGGGSDEPSPKGGDDGGDDGDGQRSNSDEVTSSREESVLPPGLAEDDGDTDTAKALEDALRALNELGLGDQPPQSQHGGQQEGQQQNAQDGGLDDVTEADLKLVEEFISSLGDSLNGLGGGGLENMLGGAAAANPSSSASVSTGSNVNNTNTNGNQSQSQQQQQHQQQQQPIVEKLVESIVGHLLSEDVLKEPMLQMRAAYKEWLPNNEANLSAEDRKRYRRQQELVEQICAHYERGAAGVTEVMELLSYMQETGSPPDAIMNQLSNDGGMDGFLQRLGALDFGK